MDCGLQSEDTEALSFTLKLAPADPDYDYGNGEGSGSFTQSRNKGRKRRAAGRDPMEAAISAATEIYQQD